MNLNYSILFKLNILNLFSDIRIAINCSKVQLATLCTNAMFLMKRFYQISIPLIIL